MTHSYALVGTKHSHLINELVHKTHQTGKTAVTVNVRVMQYNHDMFPPSPHSLDSPHRDDMVPVYCQLHYTTHQPALAWENMPRCSSKLTASYVNKKEQMVINGETVDLVNMKVRGIKIRCLN